MITTTIGAGVSLLKPNFERDVLRLLEMKMKTRTPSEVYWGYCGERPWQLLEMARVIVLSVRGSEAASVDRG